MAAIAKTSFLVRLLRKKTKIRMEDIAEILNLLTECAAEAFFEANPAEKEIVNFGVFNAYWKNTNLGPGIFFKPSKPFQKHTARVKYEQKTELAVKLYAKMLPKNRERAAKRIEKNAQDIVAKNTIKQKK
jgi:hypothetical protein